jgi:hypothetical protein
VSTLTQAPLGALARCIAHIDRAKALSGMYCLVVHHLRDAMSGVCDAIDCIIYVMQCLAVHCIIYAGQSGSHGSCLRWHFSHTGKVGRITFAGASGASG